MPISSNHSRTNQHIYEFPTQTPRVEALSLIQQFHQTAPPLWRRNSIGSLKNRDSDILLQMWTHIFGSQNEIAENIVMLPMILITRYPWRYMQCNHVDTPGAKCDTRARLVRQAVGGTTHRGTVCVTQWTRCDTPACNTPGNILHDTCVIQGSKCDISWCMEQVRHAGVEEVCDTPLGAGATHQWNSCDTPMEQEPDTVTTCFP